MIRATWVLELVMDGAYASKAWRGLPDRVTLTTRMRSNAAVYDLAPAAAPTPERAAPSQGHPPGEPEGDR